jgi:glutaryl-CoA dehydrogenase
MPPPPTTSLSRTAGNAANSVTTDRLPDLQERLVKMLAEVCSMQLYCLQLGRLQESGTLTDTIAAIAKMNNTAKPGRSLPKAETCWAATASCEYHVMWQMAEIETLRTYEGAETTLSPEIMG